MLYPSPDWTPFLPGVALWALALYLPLSGPLGRLEEALAAGPLPAAAQQVMLVLSSLLLALAIGVLADLAREDAEPEDGRVARWTERLAPWGRQADDAYFTERRLCPSDCRRFADRPADRELLLRSNDSSILEASWKSDMACAWPRW